MTRPAPTRGTSMATATQRRKTSAWLIYAFGSGYSRPFWTGSVRTFPD